MSILLQILEEAANIIDLKFAHKFIVKFNRIKKKTENKKNIISARHVFFVCRLKKALKVINKLKNRIKNELNSIN